MKQLRCFDFSFFEGLNDSFYLSSEKNNIILKINKNNFKIMDVFSIPNEEMESSNLVGHIFEKDGKIIIIPRNAKKVWIADVTGFKGIDIKKYVKEDCAHKFLCSYIYNNHIYLFGHYYCGILGINLDNLIIDFHFEFPQKFIEIKEKKNDAFIAKQICVFGDEVYLPFISSNYIFKFNLINHNIIWIKIGNTEDGFSGITRDEVGNGFWISRRDSNGLIWWNGIDKSIEYYFDDLDTKMSLGVCNLGSKIIIPNYKQNTYIFNKQNKKCIEEEYIYSEMKEVDGYYYIVKDNCIISLKRETEERRETYIDATGIELFGKRALKKEKNNIRMLMENEIFNLDGLINAIK